MKKIFVTGGHFTPAKAVVEELLKKDFKVFYVGRKHALEGDQAISLEFQEMSGRTDVTFLEITAGRVPRKLTSKSVSSLLKIPVGLFQSLNWILKYRPDAIMSFGGYVSIPISTVAFLFGIPIVNHEQIPAFDYPSKYLNSISKKVLVSFPHLVKKDEVFTGNPVRPEIFKKKIKHQRKTIYVTGGNQGSHTINKAVLEIIDSILDKFDLIWQTGDSKEYKDFDNIPRRDHLTVRKFIPSTEIGDVFAKSDLVISRAGANTVTELAALGIPSILIPIPWVHDSEQQKNADTLAEFGGSKVLAQDSLTPQTLLSEINEIMSNLKKFQDLSEKAKSLYIKDSAKNIVNELESILHEKKN